MPNYAAFLHTLVVATPHNAPVENQRRTYGNATFGKSKFRLLNCDVKKGVSHIRRF